MLRLTLLPFLAVPFALTAAPIPYTKEEAQIRASYGVLSDPNDVAVRLDGNRLRIRLPARSPGDTPDPPPRPGPCVWKEVTGDFEVTVRVSFTHEAEQPRARAWS